jgi:hypothetical protein
MAVWQFELEAIPAAAAVVDGAPAIYLTPETRSGIELRLTHETRRSLVTMLDRLLPSQPAWSGNLCVWGNTRSTDVQLYSDDDGTHSLMVRLDARGFSVEVLETLCAAAASFEWLFLTERGAVLQPNSDIILRALQGSSARTWVENPQRVIDQAVARIYRPS